MNIVIVYLGITFYQCPLTTGVGETVILCMSFGTPQFVSAENKNPTSCSQACKEQNPSIFCMKKVFFFVSEYL